ncbi:MAG: glycoside hydrolase family 95-like protein, partial [bacterium]
MQNIQRVKGVFNGPPANFPTGASTGAALLGNGDVLVAAGGAADSLTFRFSKLDFWQAREEAGPPGGPRAAARTIGALTLGAPALSGASYLLEQSIHDATIRGRFEKGGAILSMTAWTPRGENVLVVELQATGREKITIQPVIEIQDGNDSVVDRGVDNGIAWYQRRFETPNLLWKTAVTVATRPLDNGPITLEPGRKHTLVLALVTNHDTPDHRARALALVHKLNDTGLADARARHLDWWSALWLKCAKVEIGDEYLEDRYYGSHYILASCCGNRNFAPGLFAWITNDWPGWGSDYHANYNFEAAWWGVLTSNLVELADPYDQAVMDYLPRMKAYAKRFLNVRGAYCNVGFGPKGLHVDIAATPYDEGLNFHGQKSNASFLACNMIMRYYLTQDLDYARRYAYPYLVEVMNFWEDYLTFEPFDRAHGGDGRYVSRNDCVCECLFFIMLPEDSIEFERAKEKNPPLSLGLIRMVSRAAIELSTALGVDEHRRGKWQHILDHISAFPLTDRNGKTMFDVCENGITKLEDVNMCCIQHIYPANAVSLSSDPALVHAGVDTILYKDLWENGNSFSTIFAAAARVGVDPDLILRQMKRVTEKYIQPNFLFSFGGGGIENNSGIPDGLNEMLLQSHEGFLRLFPCWPKDRLARFDGLRACGAFLVSSELAGGEVKYVRIVSEKGLSCTVLNPWSGAVQVVRNGMKRETVSGERFTLPTVPGESIELLKRP